jgi:hypothetical protein
MPPLRLALVVAGLVTLVPTVGLIGGAAWATSLWPWEASPLSHLFLASILAAIAVPVLWIGVTGEMAAMRAGAVDLGLMYGGMLVYTLTRLGQPGQPQLGVYVAVFALGLLAMVLTLLLTRGAAWTDPRPMPGFVRGVFTALTAILLAAGTALALGADIFPWPLGPETSVMFGLIYLGAAAYFACGLLDPRWPNATGQLLGFLAYDLILIGPFIARFGDVSGGERLSLTIYTVLVAASGAVAVFYLFVHDETRIRIS